MFWLRNKKIIFLLHTLKYLKSEAIIVVPLFEGFSMPNPYEVIMICFQGVIKWSHDGFRYFLIKY